MKYQNLLLIDDDADDQEIFLTALQYVTPAQSCSTSDDAKDALLRLKAGHLLPDLIFLDLNMPAMDGRQFLKEIKGSDFLKRIPVFMLSTTNDPKTIEETRNLGADRFITKPDNIDELIEVLTSILSWSPVSNTVHTHFSPLP